MAAYFSKVRISHVFPHKLAFSTTILTSFVFLLPISVMFRYLDHLVFWLPTEWHHPCVRTPVERGGVVNELVSSNSVPYFRIFLPHKTGMPIVAAADGKRLAPPLTLRAPGPMLLAPPGEYE